MRELPDILLGLTKGKAEEKDSKSEHTEAFDDAFGEYHEAMKSGDMDSAKAAFKAAMRICAMSDDEAEGDI